MIRGGDACVALAGGCRCSQDEDEGDASVPTPLRTTPAPTDTIHAFPQIPTRVGGGGVAWSGDACVALARGSRRSRDEDEGDASVPTTPSPTPAPTGNRP